MRMDGIAVALTARKGKSVESNDIIIDYRKWKIFN